MTIKKSLLQRQKELQLLLQNPAGETELQALATRYAVASGQHRWEGSSVITYILVYERVRGLITL